MLVYVLHISNCLCLYDFAGRVQEESSCHCKPMSLNQSEKATRQIKTLLANTVAEHAKRRMRPR